MGQAMSVASLEGIPLEPMSIRRLESMSVAEQIEILRKDIAAGDMHSDAIKFFIEKYGPLDQVGFVESELGFRDSELVLQLVAALSTSSSDKLVQVMEILKILARPVENKAVISDLGIKAVLEQMAHYPEDSNVLEHACAVLGNLAHDDVTEMTIITNGGAELVLGAMKRHTMKGKLQYQACGALFNLSFDESNKKHLAKLGALDLLMDALHTHPLDPQVQEEACGALGILSEDEGNRTHLAENGLLSHVLKTMRLHASNKGVARETFFALQQVLQPPVSTEFFPPLPAPARLSGDLVAKLQALPFTQDSEAAELIESHPWVCRVGWGRERLIWLGWDKGQQRCLFSSLPQELVRVIICHFCPGCAALSPGPQSAPLTAR